MPSCLVEPFQSSQFQYLENLPDEPLQVMLLCRPGFESETGQEIQAVAQTCEVYGYVKTVEQSGQVAFVCYDTSSALRLFQRLTVNDLVFARDLMLALPELSQLDPADRVAGIMALISAGPEVCQIVTWFNDTNEGKSLAKLCKKLVSPLKQALKNTCRNSTNEPQSDSSQSDSFHTDISHINCSHTDAHQSSVNPLNQSRAIWQADSPLCLNLLFTSGTSAVVGYSLKSRQPKWPCGVAYLKMPSDGPSRSTLKLDEAILLFFDKSEQQQLFGLGKTAVDLGACPGGWTYQLVKRELQVMAIDNGAMADALMKSGQVEHIKADGFHFRPPYRVNWLVCDMVEKPMRVAELMASWLAEGDCERAIFNLKLPMKKRYQALLECQRIIDDILGSKPYQLSAKQLYHDREEVTCYLAAI
jgi:23S rRNA (cytidine2498-2'-O)-methyltransferase